MMVALGANTIAPVAPAPPDDDTDVSIEEIAAHAKGRCRLCYGKGEIRVWRKAEDGALVKVEQACPCAIRAWAKSRSGR